MNLPNCNGCGLCMPCPAEIQIPEMIQLFIKAETEGIASIEKEYETIPFKADGCIRCARCEQICPEHIGLTNIMMDMTEYFE